MHISKKIHKIMSLMLIVASILSLNVSTVSANPGEYYANVSVNYQGTAGYAKFSGTHVYVASKVFSPIVSDKKVVVELVQRGTSVCYKGYKYTVGMDGTVYNNSPVWIVDNTQQYYFRITSPFDAGVQVDLNIAAGSY